MCHCVLLCCSLVFSASDVKFNFIVLYCIYFVCVMCVFHSTLEVVMKRILLSKNKKLSTRWTFMIIRIFIPLFTKLLFKYLANAISN